MKRLATYLVILAVLVFLGLLITSPEKLPSTALPGHQPDTDNGQRMFYAGGCASCHSSDAKISDLPLLGGGLEMDTAFGLFRVPNISPHPSNGIGSWSMLDFVNAMHLGSSPGGQHYYPAFPYVSYHRMPLQDIMDLKSYIDTLPAVDIPSAGHSLNFPWNIRAGIGLWKLVNLDESHIQAIDESNQLLQRGRYLVEGPGHCGECHTERNWTGGLDTSRWLAGAPNPDGEGRIPNITPHEKALADWSAEDIEYYLESGFTPDFDTVGGSMVEVQENMAHLTKDDRAAIAAYLKTIEPLE